MGDKNLSDRKRSEANRDQPPRSLVVATKHLELESDLGTCTAAQR